MAAIRDLAANFRGDVGRGLKADNRAMLTGVLVALCLSVPLIIGLSVLTPLGVGGSIAVGMFVQLFLGWALAGREMRRNR
ncbi:hypothetical protein [Roseicitreum antarcticum]|uniref:Uncharacterized protein n=2 Tax=Roseicitreum antarcticum TaxID=564137 RepID=A0A1H3D7Z6_9RHOB|nr:hypothetical protein [Roseicitreum antarcticum]SDX62248.1 hypothetical protein SAMN04488238_11222 [Roseicitreum antarcticum]